MSSPATTTPQRQLPVRVMHPTTRALYELSPFHLAHPSWRGYVRAPWDCRCTLGKPCTCQLRPSRPPADRIAEAEADVRRLLDGLNQARAELLLPELALTVSGEQRAPPPAVPPAKPGRGQKGKGK